LILTRSNENCDISLWIDLINKTKAKRKIILIIDESHLNAQSDLANQIKEQIKPKIIINVSATPINGYTKGSDVMIDDDCVIESGIIKQSIIFQTEEDINSINKFKELDQDEKMLELAFQKRTELVNAYRKLNVDVRPLVMVQLPNDSEKYGEKGDALKQKIINYLCKKIKDEYATIEYKHVINPFNYLAI
jgi:type III restriction enzyme